MRPAREMMPTPGGGGYPFIAIGIIRATPRQARRGVHVVSIGLTHGRRSAAPSCCCSFLRGPGIRRAYEAPRHTRNARDQSAAGRCGQWSVPWNRHCGRARQGGKQAHRPDPACARDLDHPPLPKPARIESTKRWSSLGDAPAGLQSMRAGSAIWRYPTPTCSRG